VKVSRGALKSEESTDYALLRQLPTAGLAGVIFILTAS
jgi:hypothetical protein